MLNIVCVNLICSENQCYFKFQRIINVALQKFGKLRQTIQLHYNCVVYEKLQNLDLRWCIWNIFKPKIAIKIPSKLKRNLFNEIYSMSSNGSDNAHCSQHVSHVCWLSVTVFSATHYPIQTRHLWFGSQLRCWSNYVSNTAIFPVKWLFRQLNKSSW